MQRRKLSGEEVIGFIKELRIRKGLFPLRFAIVTVILYAKKERMTFRILYIKFEPSTDFEMYFDKTGPIIQYDAGEAELFYNEEKNYLLVK